MTNRENGDKEKAHRNSGTGDSISDVSDEPKAAEPIYKPVMQNRKTDGGDNSNRVGRDKMIDLEERLILHESP